MAIPRFQDLMRRQLTSRRRELLRFNISCTENVYGHVRFKYDVLRTLKRDKYKGRHGHKTSKVDLNGVDERDTECKANQINLEGEEDDEGQGEAASLLSSAWTSIHSRYRTDAPEDENDTDPSPTNSPVRDGIARSEMPKLMTQ